MVTRRNFIKTGLIFVPLAVRADDFTFGDAAFLSQQNAATGGSCTTEVVSDRTASASGSVFGNTTATIYTGYKITSASNFTACALGFYLSANGSPTFNVFGSLYSHNAGDDSPDTRIGTESSAYAASNVTSEAEHILTGLSASITNGQVYWLVIRTSAVDAGNNLNWRRRTATGRINQDGDGVGVWSNLTTGRVPRFAIYSA